MSDNASKDLMEIVLQHYLKHHEIILKKLVHAQKATEMSMAQLREMSDANNAENVDVMWAEIINMFRDFAASEDELFNIEDLLGTVPKTIKEPYEELVENDDELQKLKAELDSDEYKKAKEAVNRVQAEPNPMSGMTADEYAKKAEDSDMVKALRFVPPNRKH